MERMRPVFAVMLGILATGAMLNFMRQFSATKPVADFIGGGYE